MMMRNTGWGLPGRIRRECTELKSQMQSCQPGEEESEECSRQREQQCEQEGEGQRAQSTVGRMEGPFPRDSHS